MKEILYENEHLLPGNIGKFMVVLAFVSAIGSAVSYFFGEKNKDHSWAKLGRLFFVLHSAAVVGIFISLYYIIQNHLFEYHYAWQHSNKALPTRYMISCFWEGQEGSFLLWMFWHSILGIILLFRSKAWESSVMAVVSFAQIILGSMLLGLPIGEVTIGSSPFNLMRDVLDAPIFQKENYMTFIQDGSGLNPLLQNYWMVIHPPTLFLGFASSVVPFAFSVAGLWRGKFTQWIRAAMPWTLFCIGILGLGIVMGAFWAYESLSFGGYWAWDPVENASLVPWLVVLAANHVMLIQRANRNHLLLSFILVIASFLLVLYATFLTRSGILGDTSVHSFTDLGLSGQLLVFVFFLNLLPILAISKKRIESFLIVFFFFVVCLLNFFFPQDLRWLNISAFILLNAFFGWRLYHHLPLSRQEENIYARGFWMFIGSLILLLSAFQILLTTSIPVFNKLFALDLAPPIDVIEHYNQWQLWFALGITTLTSIGQFFSFKQKKKGKYQKTLLILLILALFLGGFLWWQMGFSWKYGLLIISSLYAIFGNLFYLLDIQKIRWKLMGGSVAHIGFALMIVGVIISGTQKEVISQDKSGILEKEFDLNMAGENLLLWKNSPTSLGPYLVTYRGDTSIGPDIYFQIDYEHKNGKEKFSLFPNAQIGEENNLMANPATKHYISHDVFTHITSIPIKDEPDEWKNEITQIVGIGDTLDRKGLKVIVESIEEAQDLEIKADLIARATIKVLSVNGAKYAYPKFFINGNQSFTVYDALEEEGLLFTFRLNPQNSGDMNIVLNTAERPAQPDYIIMKAIVFPWINLLWLGSIIMTVGFGISLVKRMKDV
ncbi:MAG: Cytochrome c-type biogenesis protein CcmF [Bacteroidetes bacterium MED-G17]|nr:MAG: hypothetical protein CBB99_06055 [Bacteroidetes bacterium TMED39]CAI8337570.1 MAG: Cytochrome c-type biogenesis protein CcmF [Bacteroidetes bacterium MED-G17]